MPAPRQYCPYRASHPARRKIFGTVRYQSENSLRKFDAKAYLRTVEDLCRAEAEDKA